MHSLTITEKTNQGDLTEFKRISGVDIKFHNRTCDLSMAIDYGDTIHAETRVLDIQESKSKNDRGTVLVETKGFNQDGKEVCYFRRRVMVWKREFAPSRRRPYDGQDVWAD